MAVWNPPQPMWKRNLVGILDFLLALAGSAFLLLLLGMGTSPPNGGGVIFGPGPSLLLLVMIVTYFGVLGRTGGTVFQRFFAMKRAAPGESPASPPREAPLWKRNLAGILDFVLAGTVFSFLLVGFGLARFGVGAQGMPAIQLKGGSSLVLLGYIVSYFVGLRRTGGTIFQRVLRVKRRRQPAWDPPQPRWKRNLAGILDFVLAGVVLGVVLDMLSPGTQFVGQPGTPTAMRFAIPWQVMLLPALIVGYFAVLGGTGGTVFQRVLGMKRGRMSREDCDIVEQF